MKITKLLVFALSLSIFFTSCSNDDDPIVLPMGNYENGILISNEGNWGQGNASISFVSYNLDTVENNVFNSVNTTLLGDVAQSIAFYNDLAFIVVNSSNKIEIVNRYTFETVATIDSGLVNPRYIAFSNGKGYVTNWGEGSDSTDDYIAVIDLNTNTLESNTISVVEGPEEIVAAGDKIYIAHEGGWSQNNKVSVLDAKTNAITAVITVGDVPNTLQLDNSGNLWVLCEGAPEYASSETAGQLVKIDTSNNTTITSIDFDTTDHPDFLSLYEGNLYYYLGGDVFKMESTSVTRPTIPEISGVNFYNMTINNGTLYGVDAKGFSSEGELISYDLASKILINTATVNIGPGGIYFN